MVSMVKRPENHGKVRELLRITSIIVQQYSMSIESRNSSSDALSPEELEVLGFQYLNHIRNEFPFAKINHYQHLVTAHTREIFDQETLFSPGDLSAQAQEKKNKNFAVFRSQYSSKVSLKKNLEHAFLRDWLYSSPILANIGMSEQKRQKYACSFCKRVGHTIKKCPQFHETLD